MPRSKATTRQLREKLRLTFLPSPVRLLFVGESPPASGKFFYQRDSGLYRAMLEAFQTVDPSISEQSFPEVFRSCGCYLVDLCAEPVDQLDDAARRAACRDGERTLSKAIRQLRPTMIATLVRSIEGNVANAADGAKWNGPGHIHLPYPGRWIQHKAIFTEALVPVIRDLLRSD